MCNCSEHESSGSLAKMTGASVEPAMKPLVPLSRQISIGDDESGDEPAATDLKPFPPFRLCKLDFREGCYQINFRPTASLVSFEGTLRVDRAWLEDRTATGHPAKRTMRATRLACERLANQLGAKLDFRAAES